MSLSKRQQARNERALQDLIKSVPGNSTCADCQARNPAWASWSLGIFLCMRCAALHRKLGTHISKVKSLSMDSWSNDQVENMRSVGNLASNRTYNPQNTRPPIPIDADEADSAMERFIRQKYRNAEDQEEEPRSGGRPLRKYSGNDSDDQGPPLPPKQGGKFSFRSASSMFPMSSKAKREAAATAHIEAGRERERNVERQGSRSPPGRNKPSRVFGQTFSAEDPGSSAEDLEAKLTTLRDMGFQDEKRNLAVLKGLYGNLEKSIETLVRLGEGSVPSSRSRTPLSAGLSPTSGLTINRSRDVASPKPSNDPWEISAPPQSSQSTGAMAPAKTPEQINTSNYQTANNPFQQRLQPSQSQYSLHQQYSMDQAFSNMSVSGSQPLFPNHTGGAPNGSNSQPFQAAAAPPMPSIPQGLYSNATYGNPQEQNFTQQTTQSYNPFLQQSQPSPAFSPTAGSFSSNPYASQQRAQTYPLQSPQQTIQEQPGQQQSYFDHNQAAQSPLQMDSSNPFGAPSPQPTQQSFQSSHQTNPFGVPMQQSQQPQQQNNPYSFQPHQAQPLQQQQQTNPYGYQPQQPQLVQTQPQYGQFQPQQPSRADNTSIMALYNYPQLAPAPPQTQSQNDMAQAQPFQSQPQNSDQGHAGGPLPLNQQPRSMSSPLVAYNASSRNPFMSTGVPSGPTSPFSLNAPTSPFSPTGPAPRAGSMQGPRHVSQESMSVDTGGWHGQNGRHSPDAFASLSARSMR